MFLLRRTRGRVSGHPHLWLGRSCATQGYLPYWLSSQCGPWSHGIVDSEETGTSGTGNVSCRGRKLENMVTVQYL